MWIFAAAAVLGGLAGCTVSFSTKRAVDPLDEAERKLAADEARDRAAQAKEERQEEERRQKEVHAQREAADEQRAAEKQVEEDQRFNAVLGQALAPAVPAEPQPDPEQEKLAAAAGERVRFADKADAYMADHGGWSFQSISTAGNNNEGLVLEDDTCSRTSLHRFVKKYRTKLLQLGFAQVDCAGPADEWYELVK